MDGVHKAVFIFIFFGLPLLIVDDMYKLNDKVTSIEDLKYVTQDTVDSLCGRMEIEGEVVLYGQPI